MRNDPETVAPECFYRGPVTVSPGFPFSRERREREGSIPASHLRKGNRDDLETQSENIWNVRYEIRDSERSEDKMIPQLSIQERDRRYKIVRAEMARRGIDVLLAPANTGRWEQLQGDSRYLTTIGGFATEVFTVFPREGEVTAFIFNRAAWWRKAQNWVTDVRPEDVKLIHASADVENRFVGNVLTTTFLAIKLPRK